MKESGVANDQPMKALELPELFCNRQATCESRVVLTEGCVLSGHADDAAASLERVTELITDSQTDLLLAGGAQRVHGLLKMAHGDAFSAAQHFGRSVSIFDLLGDRYRSARAHFELARAYAVTQPEQVAEHLSHATNMFRELGARLDLQKPEETFASLDRSVAADSRRSETIAQLLTLRLAEAVASRELLLHELVAVIRQETKAKRIVIVEPNAEVQRVVIAHGCDRTAGERLAEGAAVSPEDAARDPI